MKRVYFVFVSIFLLFLVSCNQELLSDAGSVKISLPFGPVPARAAEDGNAPNYDYVVKITHSSGTETEKKGKSGDTIIFDNVKTGSYKVYVEAYTQTEFLVYTGENTTTVQSGLSAEVTVNMQGYDGSKAKYFSLSPDLDGIKITLNKDAAEKDGLMDSQSYFEDRKTKIRLNISEFYGRGSSEGEETTAGTPSVSSSASESSIVYPFSDKNTYYGFDLVIFDENGKEKSRDYAYCKAGGGNKGLLPSVINNQDSILQISENVSAKSISAKWGGIDFFEGMKISNPGIIGAELNYVVGLGDFYSGDFGYIDYNSLEYNPNKTSAGTTAVDAYNLILNTGIEISSIDGYTVDHLIAGFSEWFVYLEPIFYYVGSEGEEPVIYILPPLLKSYKTSLGKEYKGPFNNFTHVPDSRGNYELFAVYHNTKLDETQPIITVSDEKYNDAGKLSGFTVTLNQAVDGKNVLQASVAIPFTVESEGSTGTAGTGGETRFIGTDGTASTGSGSGSTGVHYECSFTVHTESIADSSTGGDNTTAVKVSLEDYYGGDTYNTSGEKNEEKICEFSGTSDEETNKNSYNVDSQNSCYLMFNFTVPGKYVFDSISF